MDAPGCLEIQGIFKNLPHPGIPSHPRISLLLEPGNGNGAEDRGPGTDD